MCACVCMCVRACVCVCVRVCVLNVVSPFDDSVFVWQCEMDSSFVDLLHAHDVQLALSQVRGGKAAGSSGILPEVLKIG